MTAVHPTDDRLIAYGLGKMDDTAAEEVLKHLEGCEACKRRVAELSADSFVDRLRQGHDAKTPGSGYTGLSAAVRAMPQVDDKAVPPELLTLKQYADLRELGRGGMGVVYVAHNTDMDRPEVLKVVQRSSLERVGTGAVERFLREIQAAARLQHKNVVAAYTVHRPGDLLVFAMEYAPGQDLSKVVRTKGPLAVPVACSYVHEAALGLQHAHEAKMVHRDIKPGNLILTKVNGKPAVKVLDFGLAKVTTGDKASGELTGDGKMMGTPDYMAPEQALDAAKADIRADVYSLGCTLYYLLAGRPPFGGGSLLAVIDHHRYTEATPLNLVQPTVPTELAAAVAKMMAKDPAKRFQTPLEVAKAVRPFISQPAAKPPGPTTPRPATSETSRPEQTAPEQVAPRQPEPADDWAAMTASGPRPKPAVKAPAPPRRQPAWLWPAVACCVALLGLAGAWAAGVFVKVQTPNGTIVIDGVPDGAVVFVDGQEVKVSRNGETVTVSALKEGPHKLRMVHGGKEVLAKDEVVVTVGGVPVRVGVELPTPPAPVPPTPKPANAPTPGEKPVTPPAPKSPTPPATETSPPLPAPSGGMPTPGQGVAVTDEPEAGFKVMFDGKQLNGWSLMRNSKVESAIQDGLLRLKAAEGEYWFRTTRNDYANYRLRMEVRSPDTLSKKLHFRASDELRPSAGYCFDLGGLEYGGRGSRPLGKVNGKRDDLVTLTPATLPNLPPNRWNTLELIAQGDTMSMVLDGQVVSAFRDPLNQRKAGTIQFGFYVPGALEFRKIEIEEFPVSEPTTAAFVPLFNGKDLSGWNSREDKPGRWRVEGGVVVGSGSPHALLRTDRENYENFHLQADVMMSAAGDAGIYFRSSQSGSYEAQITCVADASSLTGTLYKFPPVRAIVRAGQGLVEPGKWFALEIVVIGDRIQILVDRTKTVDFVDRNDPYRKGAIVLQQYRPEAVVKFRSVRIKELPAAASPAPAEPKPSAVAPKPATQPKRKLDDATVPAEAAALLKVALASRQKPLPIVPPKDLADWGDKAKPTGTWTAGDDGVLVGSGTKGMTFPRGVAHTDFYLKFEATAAENTHGGVVIRRRVRPLPNERGTVHTGYYIPINTSAQTQTGRVGRWRNIREDSMLAASAVQECLPQKWYAFEVVAVGGRIAVFVDGVFASFWSEPTADPLMLYKEGVPTFRVERGTVSFRNVEVKELDAAAIGALPPPKR